MSNADINWPRPLQASCPALVVHKQKTDKLAYLKGKGTDKSVDIFGMLAKICETFNEGSATIIYRNISKGMVSNDLSDITLFYLAENNI